MNAKHDLAEALCQLLETKTLEKITVKDIVARCGVNRQTFLLSLPRRIRPDALDL